MHHIKITFNSYDNMTFEQYVKYVNSKQGILEYFVGLPFEALQEHEKIVIDNWLGFLTNEPNIDKDLEFDLYQKSIGQKIDALSYLKKYKDKENVVEALPILISIFEQSNYDNEKNLELSIEYSKKSVIFVLEKGLAYLKGLNKIELELQKSLKPLKLKNEFVQAGFKDFQERFNDYILFDTLANGNILEYENIAQLSIEQVHANLIFKNNKAWHEQRLNEIYEAKQKQIR